MGLYDALQSLLSGSQSNPQQQQAAPPPATPVAFGGGLHSALQQGEPPMTQGSGAVTQEGPSIDPVKAQAFLKGFGSVR